MARLLKRLRSGNLVMIAGIQALLYYTVIRPILMVDGLSPDLAPLEFWILVGSVVCIAAGGYVVNDLQDVQEDAVNKPGRLTPGRLSRIAYVLLTLVGIAAAGFLSRYRHIPLVWQVNLLSALLLLAYSGFLRDWKFIGNLVIAALVALAVLLVPMADPVARSEPGIRVIVFGYAFFAFMLTWVREIIKDLEDYEGDRQYGKTTLPVLAGKTVARLVAFLLAVVVLAALSYLQFRQRQWQDTLPFLYIVTFVQVPLVILSAGLLRARTAAAFRRLSLLAKGLMISGMLSMLVFYLLY
jgi:4-hydroxybenzoate polyprenyltransferase